MIPGLRAAAIVGLPLVVAFAVIANSIALSRALAIALYALVIAVPVLAGLRAQERHDDGVHLRG